LQIWLATMREFLGKIFNQEIETRFRQVISFCRAGNGGRHSLFKLFRERVLLCKQTGWLEIAGAGMVHPEVLKNGDIDPEEI